MLVDVLMKNVDALTCAQKRLNPAESDSGRPRAPLQLGSGAGPRLTRLCKNLHEVFLTRCPPPVYLASFDAERRPHGIPGEYLVVRLGSQLPNQCLMTRWSMSSCAPASVSAPDFISLSMYTSKKASSRPREMAAPSCSLTAARYAKYVHWIACLAFAAGLATSRAVRPRHRRQIRQGVHLLRDLVAQLERSESTL